MHQFSIFGGTSALLLVALLPALPASADTPWDLKLSGRVLYDYTQADADTAAFDVDEAELRSARLAVSGKTGIVSFKVELETDEAGDIAATDAYADLAPKGTSWKFRVGQFKTPNSLEEQTSGRFTTFAERAAFTDAFEFDRRVGIAAHTKGQAWTFMAGAFGGNLNDTPGNEGFALAARGTYTPIHTDALIVHLGTSVRYREKGDDQANLRYRQRPFAHIPGRMISTGSVGESDTLLGIEGAVLRGPLWLSSEYATLTSDLAAGGDATFGGGSIEAGYVFGGERTYRGGKFDRPKVDQPVTEGGYGALAVSAAFDTLDLSDSGVDGGSMDTVRLGLSWYPTSKTRIGLSLFQSDGDLGTSTSGLDPAFADAVRAGVRSDQVTGFTLRLQADF
ncbi:OprO/OprP family phosphate-selective porin [Hyphomonas johnsonii]|uniref:Phosphate-selective porin O and P n=1 Tax=Hyphomonas johnsonii MHS-2 TaxID=1280950 RepID=A0A059F9R5_9PROT|nr:porin [Hyphomonas johnsonii]KCZ87342.1 phosphate-selective porin O and P [Hyphomonas johnsonii MHS-2]